MTTRKEDATSIVGELAEELDEQAKLIGKSEALVTRADDDAEAEEKPTTGEEEELFAEAELVEEAKSKPKDKEDKEEEMDDEEEEKGKKLPPFKKKSTAPDPVLKMLEEIKSQISQPPHVLDTSVLALKSAFDEIKASNLTVTEKLQAIQTSFEQLGLTIVEQMKAEIAPEVTEEDRLVKVIRQAIKPLEDRLEMVEAKSVAVTPEGVPQQRSYRYPPNYKPPEPAPVSSGGMMKIDDFVKRSVGG